MKALFKLAEDDYKVRARSKEEADKILQEEDPAVISIGPPEDQPPEGFDPDKPHHHRFEFHDIKNDPTDEQLQYFRPPQEEEVREMINIGKEHDDVLTHCEAGVSRSPATAYAIRCAKGEHPKKAMRNVKHDRPEASPNPYIVQMADRVLGKGGRMEKHAVQTFPHVYVPGYKEGDPEDAQTHEEYDFPEAFEKDYEHDEHFVGYDVPEVEGSVRLTKPGAKKLKEKGYSPEMKYLAADIDFPGDRGWQEGDEKKLQQHREQSELLQRAGVHSTPHGWRAIWQLDDPIDVDDAEQHIEKIHDRLEEQDIPVDRRNKDWTRMYRMPRVNRDFPEGGRTGKQKPEVIDFESMEPIRPDEI